MQYSIVGNDIALIMHYRALLKRSGTNYKQIPLKLVGISNKFCYLGNKKTYIYVLK